MNLNYYNLRYTLCKWHLYLYLIRFDEKIYMMKMSVMLQNDELKVYFLAE